MASAKTPKKNGRPTLFKPEFIEKVNKLALEGKTDAQISKSFKISEATLNNWKKQYPEFFASLKQGKEEADQIVEQSLYQRACGYSHPDTHVSNYQGAITLTGITKHYPPDTTAAIFWLKNRKPAEWRDRQELTGAEGKDLIPETDLTEAAKRIAFLFHSATHAK